MYAYVGGDPVNHRDARGLESDYSIEWEWFGDSSGFCIQQPIGETGTYEDCTYSSPGLFSPSGGCSQPGCTSASANGPAAPKVGRGDDDVQKAFAPAWEDAFDDVVK